MCTFIIFAFTNHLSPSLPYDLPPPSPSTGPSSFGCELPTASAATPPPPPPPLYLPGSLPPRGRCGSAAAAAAARGLLQRRCRCRGPTAPTTSPGTDAFCRRARLRRRCDAAAAAASSCAAAGGPATAAGGRRQAPPQAGVVRLSRRRARQRSRPDSAGRPAPPPADVNVTTFLHVRTALTPLGTVIPRIPHTPGRKLGSVFSQPSHGPMAASLWLWQVCLTAIMLQT